MPRRPDHQREYAAFGARVRELRVRLGWTQVELAEHAGLSPGYLAEMERGGRNPSLESILNLAAALDVDAGLLVTGPGARTDPDLEALCERWTGLTDSQRRALLELLAAFAAHAGPPSRSASEGASRASTSAQASARARSSQARSSGRKGRRTR